MRFGLLATVRRTSSPGCRLAFHSALLFTRVPASPVASMRFRSWPITEAAGLEPMLKDMGLRVPAAEIDGTSSGSGPATERGTFAVPCSEAPVFDLSSAR